MSKSKASMLALLLPAMILSGSHWPIAIDAMEVPGLQEQDAAKKVPQKHTDELLQDWRYPGDRIVRRGAVGKGGRPGSTESQQAVTTTADPIDIVISHYEGKVGVEPGGIGLRNLGGPEGKVVAIEDLRAESPIRIWILNFHQKTGTGSLAVNLVATPSKDEKSTNITINTVESFAQHP